MIKRVAMTAERVPAANWITHATSNRIHSSIRHVLSTARARQAEGGFGYQMPNLALVEAIRENLHRAGDATPVLIARGDDSNEITSA